MKEANKIIIKTTFYILNNFSSIIIRKSFFGFNAGSMVNASDVGANIPWVEFPLNKLFIL